MSALPKIVPQDDDPYLLHLIGLCFGAVSLKVDQLVDAGPSEQVVTPADSLREAECKQQSAQVVKPDVRIASAAQNLFESLIVFAQI